MVRWRVARFAAYVPWIISACFNASKLSDHSSKAGAMIRVAQHLTSSTAVIIVDYSLAAALAWLG